MGILNRFEIAMIFPIITVICLVWFFVYYIRISRPFEGTTEWISRTLHKPRLTFTRHRVGIEDLLPIVLILIVFIVASFEAFFMPNGALFLQRHMALPPLSMLLSGASLFLFNSTPVGWSFLGVLFGLVMLKGFYILLKSMFGKIPVAVFGTLLFGFDLTRFVQTHTAAIDAYAVAFSVFSYIFIYRYVSREGDAPFRKSVVPLALSGVFFGLAIASGPTAIYGGIGLVAVCVIRLFIVWRHRMEDKLPGFGWHLVKTLICAVLFLGVVPVIIYVLSYISSERMAINSLWDPGLYSRVWDHYTAVTAQNAALNKWSLVTFGNPVVWWGGFLAIIAMAVRAITRRDGNALFILAGFLAQLLGWVIFSQTAFIDHYFQSSVFFALALAAVINAMLERGVAKTQGQKKWRPLQAVYAIIAGAGATFVIFYPAMIGLALPEWYFRYFLRWFPNMWPF